MKRRPFSKGDIISHKKSFCIYTVTENEKKIRGVNYIKTHSNTGYSDGYWRSCSFRLLCAVEDRKDLTRAKKKEFKEGLEQSKTYKNERTSNK